MNKERKKTIDSNEISEIMTVRLGKFEQKILVEGKNSGFPVIITLHGGPGNPIPFGVGCRGLFPEITDKCILVSWDQYGCGINNAKLPDDISINDFVDMTSDLIDTMRKKFPANKVYLFGMSWGSVLATKAAVRKAYSLNGVIVYGQILYRLLRSDDTKLAIMESKAPKKVKNEVESAFENDEFPIDFAMKMVRYIGKYTNGYRNPNETKSPVGKIIRGLLSSPDYKFGDFIAVLKNGYANNHSIVDELANIDLREDIKNITIPYKIFQGETDIVTSTYMIREFVESCGNSMVSCTVIKDGAHIPGLNGMGAIMREIDLISQDRF